VWLVTSSLKCFVLLSLVFFHLVYVFIHHRNIGIVVLIYVEDNTIILVIGFDRATVQCLEQQLQASFHLKDRVVFTSF